MFCEVRLDCRAGKCVCTGRNVRRARRQHQRLSGLEAWRPAGSKATDRQSDAGAHPGHSCRTQRGLRQPAHDARAAHQRLLGQQGTGRTADARQRDLRPPQAALQGHDGLETRPGGSGRKTEGSSLRLDDLEEKTEALALQHDTFAHNTRTQLKQVFETIRQLMTPPDPPKRPIGFVTTEEEKSDTPKVAKKKG